MLSDGKQFATIIEFVSEVLSIFKRSQLKFLFLES